MPTTVTVSSNYAGKDAGVYIGQAFKEADTIQKGLVSVAADIDFQIPIKKIAYSDGRTAYACGFTPTGTVTLSEKLLTPTKIKNEFEICKEDLRQIWSSATMGFSAHNDRMPADVQSALIAEVLADTAQATDKDIWQGDSITDGQFDGFIKLFTADANIIKSGNGITPVVGGVTTANVIAELEKVKAAIPVALRRSNLSFIISPDVADKYDTALIQAGITNGLGGNANTGLVFGRYNLTIVNGLPDNTMVVYDTKNLYFGTGLLQDHNEIRIADGDEYGRLDGQVRYKMVYTAGVQYANGEDIVFYQSV